MALSGIEVIGKIIKVYDPKSGISKRNGSEWKSQEFVIEEQGGNSSFPRMCDFTVFGADRLDQFKINLGETVHVWLDINAHAWEDRYFNDVRAYRVEHVDPNSVGMPNGGYAQPMPGAPMAGGAPIANPAPTAGSAPAPGTPVDGMASDNNEDLPF